MKALPPELLQRHGGAGPRYTSYPTITHWGAAPTTARWLALLTEALQPPGSRAGIYVHVPFCQSQCGFCGCNMRLARNHALAAPYALNLLKEFAMYRADLPALALGELHLGGGSPTWLPTGVLDQLLDGLLQQARVADAADFAVEADPRNTTREQLAVLRRHGFNRLSVGVQDFDTRVLEIVNRPQTEHQVRSLVDAARSLGFGNVGFDLIYGLPLQTADSLAATFDVVATLRPERISFLPYAHVPWIKPSQRRYTDADLPDAAQRHALFLLGRERMADQGYVEIGIDQYALPADPLVAALAAGELPLQRGHVLSEEDLQIRALLWTLFSGHPAQVDPVQRSPWWPEAHLALTPLQADGLVELADGRIAVTETGRAFLRRIGFAFDRYHAQPATVRRHATS